MKILHLCLACFYIDNYSYQENLLPKYHKKMGHDVRIIASTETYDENGKLVYVQPSKYINEYGITVERIQYKKCLFPFVSHKIRKYYGLEKLLNDYCPDFIFIHGPEFGDSKIVARYAKNHSVKIVCDCHSDFSNSASSFLSYHFLHKLLYRKYTSYLIPYTSKFYGVLPARVDFLINVLKVPKEKCDLLVMGVDDDMANSFNQSIIDANRKKYHIDDDDFLIVTGGKINISKKQTLLLMDAVSKLANEKVKLIIFGTVSSELISEFNELLNHQNITFVGWKNNNEACELLSMADLVVFPGRHSVYWEQAVGLGKPLVVKKWNGTDHVNVCDNVVFLESDSPELIYSVIKNCLIADNYLSLKESAGKAKKVFLYSEIAKKSLM